MLTAFDNGRLFGAVSGAGRPWVLALHGWRRTHRDFDAVLAGVGALALDLPGFGASPPPPEGWGGAEYAKAVTAVLPDMADRVVVLGHSFGGRVAVHLAAAEPDRIAAVVLTGVPLLRPPGTGSGGPLKPALGYRIGRALHARRLLSDDRMERLRQKYGSEDYRLATGVMRAVHVRAVNETYEEQLGRITCPVELVWGDDDTAAPLAVAEAAANLLHDARVTVVPGAGHLTPLTAPDALASALERHRP